MSGAGEWEKHFERMEEQLKNYKLALQHKDEILQAREEELREAVRELDAAKTKLKHVLHLLNEIRSEVDQPGFAYLELLEPPEPTSWN